MKRCILLITTIVFSLTLWAQQPDDNDGGTFSETTPDGATLYYEVLDENARTVAVVPQHGRIPRYDQMPSGRIDIPNTVTHSGVLYIVAEVGDYAFQGCQEVTAASLPPSLKRIGNYAFAGCTGLASADLARLSNLAEVGSSAFFNCAALGGPLNVPDRVKTVGSFAFAGCAALTSLHLPEGLETIGSSAFKGCSGLRGSVTVTPRLSRIGNNAFAGCERLTSIQFYGGDYLTMGSPSAPVFANCTGITSLTIGENVSVIPDNAFKGCTGLRDMTLPRRLKRIGNSAFYQCSSLEGGLILPNGVTFVGGSAFFGCTSLTTLRLNNRLTTIEPYCFCQCTSLEGPLILPEGIETVGRAAFKGCTGMEGQLLLPASLKEVGSEAFCGCVKLSGTIAIPSGAALVGNRAFADCADLSAVEYGAVECRSMGGMGQGAFSGCTGITSVVILQGVKTIPANAFAGCENLRGTIAVPEGVTTIGAFAFSGCGKIEGVELPEGLTTIKASAFNGCAALSVLSDFPATLANIGSKAFADCSSLSVLSLLGFPPQIEPTTFQGVSPIVPVRVPCNALAAFQRHEQWGRFSNIVGTHSENRLRAHSNDSDMGTARIVQANGCGTPKAVVQAVANEGFHFVAWADGCEENPRTLIVTSDTLMEAIFDTGYTVAIAATSNDGSLGMVMGGGDYQAGDTAELIAVAFAGTTFAGWSDGEKQNPRYVAAKADGKYLALFASPHAPAMAESADTALVREAEEYPLAVDGMHIVVSSVRGHRVEIYDDYGRRIAADDEASDRFVFRAKEPGNYLIRIDGGETRRVVVAAEEEEE